MHRPKLFWLIVSILALFIIAAIPLTGFCDDVTVIQLDTGNDKPLKDGPGVTHVVDARALPALNPDGEPPIVFAFSKQPPNIRALAGFNESYYLDMKLRHLQKISPDDPVWSGNDCSDYKNTNIFSEAAYLESKLQVVTGVVGVCSGRPGGMQGRYDPATGTKAWVPLDLQVSGLYDDLAADSRTVGDRLYQVVCGANESGVSCWEPEVMQTTPVASRAWQLPGGGKFTKNLGIRYDKDGGVHMVGTDSSGQLGYVAYAPGSNQPQTETMKWLGQVSSNQSWVMPKVAVAPDGTVYLVAFNSAEGNLYVFHKAGDSADHWFFFAMSSSSGPYGMYPSLAVDNRTNNALISFRNGEGNLSIMILMPDGRNRVETLDLKYGIPYSTAATAGNGTGTVLWPSVGLDSLSVRLGAKLEF
ncbi:MAG: hypothetical protein PVG03_08060 [Desulfarculaceae bacterium]|jgi:hypothetical protein